MKTLGTMLILIATMLTAPAHADPPATYNPQFTCFLGTDADSDLIDYGGNDRWIDLDTKVVFKQCRYRRGARGRFVIPLYYTVSYNIEGSHVGCGFPNAFERIDYHFYVWDLGGRNWDKSGSLGCSEDTTNTETKTMEGKAPHLRYCDGQPPKWKNNMESIIRFEHNDHVTLRGTLWAFQGPTPSC